MVERNSARTPDGCGRAEGERADDGGLFDSVEAATEALDQRFYAYALRGFDDSIVETAMSKASPGDWWSLGDAEAVRLGPVALTRSGSSNLARARGSFQVPELPGGSYDLMICDAGCAHPLADLIPARFTVVADPATARALARVDRLDGRLERQERKLVGARAAGRRAIAAATHAQSDVEALEARILALERRGGESRDLGLPSAWVLGASLLAGTVFGSLGVF